MKKFVPIKLNGLSVFICLLTLLTACNNYNNNSDRNNINKEKPQTKEQITKEVEKITLYYDGSGNMRIVALTSNGLISMVENGNDYIDTIEFTDKDDRLFIDMQKVLGTAKIDKTLLIGENVIDSIYKEVVVRNSARGYIIDNGSFKYTIPTTDPEYKALKDGMFKDIALNDTAIKKMLALISYKNGENDIPADYMLLYQYNNKTVPNDTLCFGSSDRIVRINSYVAEVDSVLFDNVSNKIRELTFE